MQLTTTTTQQERPELVPDPVTEVVRAACGECGAHCNAVRTRRLSGSCPNCGSLDLSPLEGAEPLGISPLLD